MNKKIDNLYYSIEEHTNEKNHKIIDLIIDIENETKQTYIIKLYAKNEKGKKYEICGCYTLKELESLDIISNWEI